ncbi:collagen-like triple helix repeat-containing protein [Zobellia uliginosa]|uniref:collagen-like triple helix repeat-containing protein n=1 Tax=Zobellia uliginosa TaxID=143224 RepID=UPI0026E41357|nr:collagen-like protein [Zobellia uliginosa]MDO6516414.1 collagen-like protein [Zobellia uliginosa]
MKITVKILTSMVMVFTIALASCSKDGVDGDAGAQGETGLQGPQGEQGPKGDKGDQGEPGTVNVMYSDWLDQDFNYSDEASYKSMRVIEANLTQDFLNNGGIVLGFFRSSKNSIYQLPRVFDHGGFAIRHDFVAIHFSDMGEVRFDVNSIDDTDLSEHELTGSSIAEPQYRYVMIPGGVSLSGRSSRPNFEKMSYEEIAAYFDLED